MIKVNERITKECGLYINEIYKAGNVGEFIDLLCKRMGHPLLSDVQYQVVGHTSYDCIIFEVSGIYEDEEAMRLDGVLDE
ncbi:MAG: hypothetical protein ACYTBS_24270 [Planctomycetota bacterium]|jgi:hypothetical protein